MLLTRRDFLAATTAAALFPSARSAEFPETIRAAVLGLEGHYSDLTGAKKNIPQLRIVAVSDHRPEALRRASGNGALQEAKGYADHRELLAKEKLDLVCICGENAGRAALIKECAERGLAIVTEKPIALTLEELAEVKRVIEKTAVPLTMLLTMRGTAPYVAMREIVRGGQIGEVISMDAQKSYKLGERPAWMKSHSTFGGTIPYIGIHMVDLMRWISGRDMVEAAAFQSTIGDDLGEMENNCALIFRLDNRGTASLRMDYLRPETAATHGDDRLRVVGTRGIVEYQGATGVTLITATEPMQKVELPAAKPLCVDFLESIYLNHPHLLSKEDIFRDSEIALKARKAAEENKPVRL